MGASDSNFHEVCTLRDCPPDTDRTLLPGSPGGASVPQLFAPSPPPTDLSSPLCPSTRRHRQSGFFVPLPLLFWCINSQEFTLPAAQSSPCAYARMGLPGVLTDSWASSVGLRRSAARDVSPRTLRTDSMTSGKLLNFLCLSLSRKNRVSNSTALTGSLPRVTELAANIT